MKKSYVMKALYLVVGLMMILPMAACTASPAAGTAAPAVSSAAAETAPAAEATSSAPVELDVFLNHTWYPTDKYEGIIPQVITEKTGVVFKPTRAADEGQLGLMIASGDLPGMIFTETEQSRLSNADLCFSYTDLIAQYEPDWKPSDTAIVNASSYSQDGKYYFLFSHSFTQKDWDEATSGVPMVGSLQYRGDIAAKLGFTPDKINSFADLEALFAAVKQAYPDMDPFVASAPPGGTTYFKAQFGITDQTDYLEADGKYVHTINSKNYEDCMKLLNSWYQKGYIDGDGFAQDEATNDETIISGKAFSYNNVTQGYAYTQSMMGKKSNPDFQLLELKPLGENAQYRLTTLGWSATFITKNCKDPKAAIHVMKYLFSPEGGRLSMWGREGTEYTLLPNGAPKFSDEWVAATGDEQTFASKYNTNFYFGASALTEAVGRTAALGPEYQDVYTLIRKKIVCEPWYALAAPKDPNSEIYTVMNKIRDMVKNSEPSLIMSKSDAEFAANLQKMRDDAKTIGVDKYDEFMNKGIAEAKAKFK